MAENFEAVHRDKLKMLYVYIYIFKQNFKFQYIFLIVTNYLLEICNKYVIKYFCFNFFLI